MPVDYQQIHARIKEIGAGARERRKTLDDRRKKARDLLLANSDKLDFLRAKVNSAKAVDANIRCAYPLNESLTSHYPLSASAKDVTIIAADGSQINPDRHAAVQFCLINVGAIVMRLNSGQSPEIYTNTELFYGDELEEYKLTNEGSIALRRDLDERVAIDDISKDLKGSILNFIDGTMEIWGAKDIEDAKAYERSVQSYLTILSRLQSRGIATAGYVDKPSANLVVRLLEMVMALPKELENLRDYHSLEGTTDLWLFGDQNDDFQLLKPGERSAVFGLQSGSEKYYKGALSLHFFYLNVSGSERHPQIARVEVPKWLTEDKEKLDLVQSVLLEQCGMLGSRPYPYVLNRAHEIAVVKQEEKQQIEQMLAIELRRNREQVGNASNKQGGKNSLASGRKRYGK